MKNKENKENKVAVVDNNNYKVVSFIRQTLLPDRLVQRIDLRLSLRMQFRSKRYDLLKDYLTAEVDVSYWFIDDIEEKAKMKAVYDVRWYNLFLFRAKKKADVEYKRYLKRQIYNYSVAKRVTKSQKALYTISRGFFLLLIVLYYMYIEYLKKPQPILLHLYYKQTIISINRIINFVGNYSFKVIKYNKKFKLILEFFLVENRINKDFYLVMFNFLSFFKLNLVFVLLNLEELKYEDEKVRTNKIKWNLIKKMNFEFLNIGWWRLNFQKIIIFFNYCMFEFFLYFQKVFINKFNSKFFHRNLKKKLWIIDLESYSNKNITLFKNFKEYLINVKSFRFVCLYTLFILWTTYIIFVRRVLYNYYIKNHIYFYEFQGLKKNYILINNPFCHNKTKMYFFYYQRNFLLKFLKVKGVLFHIWFKFYNLYYNNLGISSCEPLIKFNEYKNYNNKFIKILKDNKFIKILLQFKKSEYFNLNDNLFNDIFCVLYFQRNFILGFRDLMSFYSAYKYKVPKTLYATLQHFVDTMLCYPSTINRFYASYKKRSLYPKLFCNLMNDTNIFGFIFLRNFLNFIKNDYYLYYFNLLKSKRRLDKEISFFFVDSLFFNDYYSENFPMKMEYFEKLDKYSKNYLIYIYILNKKILNIFFYKNIYLDWKLNTAAYSFINFYKNSIYIYSQNIVGLIHKNYVKNFFKLFYIYYMKLRKNLKIVKGIVDIKFRNESIYDIYLQLLFYNIDLILISLFIYKDKFEKIYKDLYNYKIYKFFYLYGIYRQYALFELLEKHYYKDWYKNVDKRSFWLHKDLNKHKGFFFYSKKDDIL